MTGSLLLRNRQRTKAVNLPFLRRIVGALLQELFQTKSFDLGVYLVGAKEMTKLNNSFLGHPGSTDVITFDYSEIPTEAPRALNPPTVLHGEIFICVDEAVRQARRFKTTWQSEVARYLIHALLHLQGHDDVRPAKRRRMKVQENQLLLRLAHQFDLKRISILRKGAAERAAL
ncbi:MAG: putative rRNA maturation factor [Verrucomicrobiota bacterium]